MFWQLTIDANDPALLARFWARANRLFDPAGPYRLVAQEVADHVALGASVERRTRHDDDDDPFYFAVLHDPEGNEFCIS
jgi:hypothetical protein